MLKQIESDLNCFDEYFVIRSMYLLDKSGSANSNSSILLLTISHVASCSLNPVDMLFKLSSSTLTEALSNFKLRNPGQMIDISYTVKLTCGCNR